MSSNDDTRGVGQHHGDLRRALLDAALELVGEKDAASLSMRAVARRAGVSSGAPYHHFDDKSALLAAVAIEGFVALRAAQATAVDGLERPRDRLRAMATTYVRFAVAHRTHYAVMFGHTPHSLAPATDTALREAGQGAFRALVDAIGAVQDGSDAATHQQTAVLAWSLAHGAVDVVDWLPDLPDGSNGPREARVDTLAADVGEAIIRLCERS